MKQKESAGLAIIYRGMVLLAHTTGRKWWGSYGIPKGGIEPGESRMDAAIRETREEVGLDIPRSMIDPNPRTYVLTSRKYKYTKTVYWYTVQVEDLGQIGMKSLVVPKSRLQLEEVDWAGFMPLAEAKKRVMSSQQQLLTQLVGLGLLESHHSGEIYKTEQQKRSNTMKHVKLFEQFVNEAKVDTQKFSDEFASLITNVEEYNDEELSSDQIATLLTMLWDEVVVQNNFRDMRGALAAVFRNEKVEMDDSLKRGYAYTAAVSFGKKMYASTGFRWQGTVECFKDLFYLANIKEAQAKKIEKQLNEF